MAVKRHLNKKTTGQKKIISLSKAEHRDEMATTQKRGEDAIVRQFHRIQKGYSILMNEVAKEYDLIKDWIEKAAANRTEEWKQKISGKIPRI